jgi:hypothetical protein
MLNHAILIYTLMDITIYIYQLTQNDVIMKFLNYKLTQLCLAI